MIQIVEKTMPVVIWVISAAGGVAVAWFDVKSDIRDLNSRTTHNEEQIKDLKKNNVDMLLEMREGFRRNQESIEKLYNAILNRHN